MAENQLVQLTTTQTRMSAGEPVQSPLERVMEKKENDPKRAAAGRAGAAVRKAKQKRLLEKIQAAKESLHPPVSAATNDGTSARSSGTGLQIPDRERTERRPKHNHNWIPWIIGAVCLAGGLFAYVLSGGNMRLRASPTSEAAGPALKVQNKPSQLKASPDPHYMQ